MFPYPTEINDIGEMEKIYLSEKIMEIKGLSLRRVQTLHQDRDQ